MGNLSSQQITIALITICALMLIWSIWKKEVLTLIVKIGVGMIIIWIVNIIFPTIAIGINAITIGVAGILGVPGIIMLYIIQGLL